MSLSLSLPLCSGKAVQGARTQHSSEEFDVPGRAHSRFKASNLLQTGFSRNPLAREAPPSDKEDLRISQSSVPGLHSLHCT